MLELKVYCYDALRYTVIGDWDKVHELQSRGYYVDVKPAPRPVSEMEMAGRSNHSFANAEKYDQIFIS
jgi:hypothetical protein